MSSICAFSDRSPYVTLYTCKNQKWHVMSNACNDTLGLGYTFELMQQILTKASFFVVSYEQIKSVKLIKFDLIHQKHICTDRCNQCTQVTPIPKLDKTPSRDFACVENGKWLCDKTIDQYHELLLSRVVDKMAYICKQIVCLFLFH